MKIFKRLSVTVLSLAMIMGSMTVPVYADDVPEYTESVSESTEYAYKATAWGAPPVITETIGNHEKRVVALATSYWAKKNASQEAPSYSETPTALAASFTTGEGLLEFEAFTGSNGPIWTGTELELLRITTTDAALELTETTVVTGSFKIDWCGEVDMPFSITIVIPSGDAPEHTESTSTSTDYAYAGGDSWNADPPTVTESIGYREKRVVALATSYWAKSSSMAETPSYSATPTKLAASFTSGEGLLEFEAYIAAGPIWGGTECELLRIIPTDAALALIEDTVVTGSFTIDWRGTTQMPFSISIKAPEQPDKPDDQYDETVSDSTNYAGKATAWDVMPTITAKIGYREKYVVALATSYWARKSDVAPSSYSSEPTKLNANFTTGEGLLNFEVYIGAGPIWDGAECELLRIIPTDAALELTEDVTATGTFAIDWAGEKLMPFSVTIEAPVQDPEDENIPKPAADAGSFTVTNNLSESYARSATEWNVAPPTIKETIGTQERLVLTMCTSYWANTGYSKYGAAPKLIKPVFTSGDGLLAFEVYIGAAPIWDGAECMLMRITPTDAAQSIAENTTVSGKLPMYWCGDTEVPFEIKLVANGSAQEEEEEEEDIPDAPDTTGYSVRKSESIKYANKATGWNVQPPTIEEKIHPKEILELPIATSYWANAGESKYGSKTKGLKVNFKSGEGLIYFDVYIGKAPIWDGAECEIMRVIPTADAANITEETKVSGTISIYWCGYTDMPFEITIVPEGKPLVKPADSGTYNEIFTANEEYARAASDGNGPKTIVESMRVGDRLTVTLATSYWAQGSDYSETATWLDPVFISGEGLLKADVLIGPAPIWSGAECELLRFSATSAAEGLESEKVVKGYVPVFWCGQITDIPFKITLKPALKDIDSYVDRMVYIETGDLTEDVARAASDPRAEVPTIVGEIGIKERRSVTLCTSYWVEGGPYSAKTRPLEVKFDGEGEGILLFDAYIGAAPIWGGAECLVLRVYPTPEAATMLKDVTTITGTFSVFWRLADVEMPFEITVHPEMDEFQTLLSQDEADSLTQSVDSGKKHLPKPAFNTNKPAVEDMTEGYDLRVDFKNIIEAWDKGQSADAIYHKIDRNTDYGPQPVLKQEWLAKLPCVQDEYECNELSSLTYKNAKLEFTKNADLLEVVFSEQDGMILMEVSVTEAGMQVETPTEVKGKLFFENGLHSTEPVPVTFVIVGNKPLGIKAISAIGGGGLIAAEAAAFILILKKKKETEQ